jgi:branched-subunit amino acid aminotransferase/4-amino-4-deoxychorismate lyase
MSVIYACDNCMETANALVLKATPEKRRKPIGWSSSVLNGVMRDACSESCALGIRKRELNEKEAERSDASVSGVG